MPRFYENVEVDIDIDVDEFLSNCDKEDIKDLIESLREDGHLKIENMSPDNISYMEEKHRYYCAHLADSYLQISPEDMEIIEKLSKKYYCY
jgi:hypothetical protein